MPRSRNHVIAAVLVVVLSLANAVLALILISQGSDKLSSSGDQPPYAVIVIEVVIGLIGTVAAYGVFRSLRWAIVLALVLMVINVLISLPGIPFGPTAIDKISSVVGAIISGLAIYFLLRRDARVDPKVALNA
jgi:hypothetical protein